MAASLLPILFLSIIHLGPVQGAVPQFGALENAALFPRFPSAGLAPRWYAEPIPAIPAEPMSPNPAHIHNPLFNGSAAAARDVVVSMCGPGSHTCAEANAPGTCCPDERYCYLDANWAAQCCPLGLECKGSRCDAEHLYCNITLSTTIPVLTSSTSPLRASTTTRVEGRQDEDDDEDADMTVVTSFVSVTTSAACCDRACSTDMFSCEAAFGGHCCSYGFKCAATSLCIDNQAQTNPSNPATTTEQGIPPGCTATSQFSCAASDGGGCCDTGSLCTSQILGAETSKVCAPDPAFTGNGGGVLSSGAKAGIGVGVAVGAALVIAGITWLCIRRRRASRQSTTGTNLSALEMRQQQQQQRRSTGFAGLMRRRGDGEGRGEGEEDGGRGGGGGGGDSMFNGPGSPRDPLSAYTQRSGWSRMDGTAEAPTNMPLMQHGHPYHEHDARMGTGPYSDREGPSPPNPSLATTPPTEGGGRLAGSVPYGPEDYMRPVAVEMGGAEAREEMGSKGEQGGSTRVEEMPGHDGDFPAGRFELVGSLPSSPNPDEAEVNPMDKISR